MPTHIFFYYPYAPFIDQQLCLLSVAALRFGRLVILDPVGASWGTIGADHIARDGVRVLRVRRKDGWPGSSLAQQGSSTVTDAGVRCGLS